MDELQTLDVVKIGEDFSLYMDFAIDGVPESFSASELSSQVRDRNGGKLAQLTITAVSGVPGRFLARALPAVTVKWPEGEHFCDVKRVNTETSGSETFIVPVRKFVTR